MSMNLLKLPHRGYTDMLNTVKSTGTIVDVPVGHGILGLVLDASGNPVDGKGELTNVSLSWVEVRAPGFIFANL